MFGVFKKARQGKVEMKKMQNRDLMQALTGAMILVAGADGELEAAELDKIQLSLKSNTNLSHFGNEIDMTLAQYKEKLAVDFRTLKLYALREISDLAHDPQGAEEVLVAAIAIAEADGEIEDKEKKALTEIASKLNLRLESYL